MGIPESSADTMTAKDSHGCDAAPVGDHIGWFDWQETYREWVRDAPHKAVIVEVGVAFGKSIAFLANEAIAQGRTDLVIVGVDPWVPEDWVERDYGHILKEHGGFYEAFLAFMTQHAPKALQRIVLIKQPSVDAAAYVTAIGWKPWAVYVDGDHSEEAVAKDIAAWQSRIESGGVLAGHDFGNFGVEPAVRRAFGNDFELRGSTWLRRQL